MRTKRNNRNQHIILVVIVILMSIYTNSIRDIPKHYKSLLFVSFFNSIYYLLCRRHLVWEFIPNGINWLVIRMVHILIVTPLIVVMFLSTMPHTFWMQIIHLLRSVLIATIVEYIAHKKQLILYAHGWNILWSALLYLMMYAYSYLFIRQPLTSLVLSLFSTAFYVLKFKVPLQIKHYSKYVEPLADVYYHTFFEDLFNNKRRRIL
jgi:hypothetical protein